MIKYPQERQGDLMSIFDRDVYYSYIASTTDSSIIPLIVGFERCRKNKGAIESDKTCYILHYVLSGRGTIHIGNRDFEVHANNFFILPPHSKATYEQEKEDPWAYIWIEMSGTALKGILGTTTLGPENFIFSDSPSKEGERIMTAMVEGDAVASEESECLLITGYIYRFLAFMVTHYSKVQSQTSSKKEETVKQIERYLSIHYSDSGLSVASVAEHFCFSPSYLTRLFKEQEGLTPIQFIDETRMKKAIELLNHRTLTVNQIAEAVGYKNQFYFTKRFKRYFGMPPTKYKQKNLVDLG